MTDREIDAIIAEKVMGWRIALEGEKPPQWKDDLVWIRADHELIKYDWKFTTDPRASKQVREKLAERFKFWRFNHWTGGQYHFLVWNDVELDTVDADADTEERAVALCALKTVGVEP